ncbi:hypothetical protein AUK40_00800 [Candidatus Wirthbacteria bacterium CG2_30_54_11]|uniref:AAA+ ATPase domain-containing protein n=1 Tax=Candidatus Wirthbacteria bacterium CG2_30_54_11 TaxID=1817892 RepID=A0A1J5J6K1_9BACT|nr:MAG: hypothetical protein AUK40_00800 [Candidatus Wirthbacteria bacterium CG2_30_54_11]
MNRTKQLALFFAILGMALLVSIWIGYQFLDPFNRDTIIATIPFDLSFSLISTFLFVVFNRIFHGMGGLGFVESKLVHSSQISVSFADVIGIDEAVEEAREVVQIVKDRMTSPKKKTKRIIRGLLLLGPPGCGKTLLAKAIATEAGLPFLALSGSDFVEKWHSLGASRIRGVFKEARRLSEQKGACVIFIDELDVIGRMRDFSTSAGEEETNRTLTQLLVEMDGLNQAEKGNIIVIAATNASEDVLDRALLRPGRFDRKLYVDIPGSEGREKLFRHFLSRVSSEKDIPVHALAQMSTGKNAADIENIVREAALIAAKENHATISLDDLMTALDKLELGMRSHAHLSDKERIRVAYHESGHLLAARFFSPEAEIVKVSIAPRRRKFSVVQQIPKEDVHIRNKETYLTRIRIHLGGYAAERIMFENTSELVREDFIQATAIAREMVWAWGMGSSGLIGNYHAIDVRDISDTFKQHLDNDSETLLRQSLEATEELLTRNRGLLERVAARLLEKEELKTEEILAIFKH